MATVVKVSEASGGVLDLLVGKCEGLELVSNHPGYAYIPKGKRTYYKYQPSTNPKQAWPIIDREGIAVEPTFLVGYTENRQPVAERTGWQAKFDYSVDVCRWRHLEKGPSSLIAAMRCYVVSRLGHEVEL